MIFDITTVISSIVASIALFILGGLFKQLLKLFKRFQEIKKWKEAELDKGKSELGQERFSLVVSPEFIPTMGQKESPHDSYNNIISDNRFLLVDSLLKKILIPNEGTWKKRYAILGGTGMGKSTFTAHLIYKYINQYKFSKPKYPIIVKYLGQKNILKDLQSITDASDVRDTILVLDALDENSEAIKAPRIFFSKLEELTDKFRIIILTSRTQFFSNKQSEPTKGRILQNNPISRFLPWEIIYISPFNEEETVRYLEAKYKIPSKEYSKAKKIADMSNDLLMRPMILSFIDDLLDLADNKTILASEVYARIIEKWLVKECEGQLLNKSDLFSFSKKLSLFIYNKWEQSEELIITEEEFQKFMLDNGYHNSPYSFRDRSLLNRRSDGSIKFSHKSFWEFFLAINSIENPGKSFKPKAFDTAEQFSKELYQLYIDGKGISDVNYCPPTIFEQVEISSLDAIANKALEVYKSSSKNSEKDTSMHKLLYEYCQIAIKRLAIQYEELEMDKIEKLNENDLSNYVVKMFAQDAPSRIQRNFHKLQECFLNLNQQGCKDLCRNLMVINSLKKPVEYQNKEKPRLVNCQTNNNFVVFPCFFSEKFLNKHLSNNYINIGMGFNENDTIYEIIKKCTTNRRIDIVCVYRESNNLEHHVEFVKGLNNCIGEILSCILLVIKIETVILYYIVNRETKVYNTEQIRLCLSNMISINSLVEDCEETL